MEPCILVVDDDREIVQAIAILLEKEGYRVLRAYNGLEALELAARCNGGSLAGVETTLMPHGGSTVPLPQA